MVDANGQPLDNTKAMKAQNLQELLWNESSTARDSLRKFAETAGINVSLQIQSVQSGGGGLKNLNAIDCGIGIVGTGIAFAAWIAEPIDPLAYWGFAAAYTGTARVCS